MPLKCYHFNFSKQKNLIIFNILLQFSNDAYELSFAPFTLSTILSLHGISIMYGSQIHVLHLNLYTFCYITILYTLLHIQCYFP
jgi:hypothetical protein